MLVCFFLFAREAAGAQVAPGIPCALCFGEGRDDARPGRERAAGRWTLVIACDKREAFA
jgi:hypothetical protein